ncbi:hypothetical protein ACCO45_003017 [Purpureocillium lilacinum]|uniref:Uncharacterized protein n=1 Tax=Purpureocillium lilacinum TaxID=33203 RepID=A0ACC4E064_PURLI
MVGTRQRHPGAPVIVIPTRGLALHRQGHASSRLATPHPSWAVLSRTCSSPLSSSCPTFFESVFCDSAFLFPLP